MMGGMGAPRARTGPDLVTGGVRRSGSAAAALDFAVTQILGDETGRGALRAVLVRLADAFGLRAALAFQPPGAQRSAAQPPAVLGVHPAGAADQALLARIGALTLAQRASAAARPLPVTMDGQAASALLAYSVPVGGQCLCALALIGDPAGWNDEIRATAHAVAAIVATQIRHANDMARIERSRAALADQTERLNCLIASAIPGVLITDEQGAVTNVSQSFGIMFGLDGPLAGTSAVSVMRRIERVFADPFWFTRRAVAVFRARQPTTGEQIRCADGRTVEFDYWRVLVDGRYRGDIWLAWDMSDRQELEQQRLQMLEAELTARRLAEQAQRQLAEQNERLQKLDEARNQFLAIVSHELRTPLTSIVSFSELIRGEAEGLTQEGVRFLDIIERNADRLHRLVGDLLMLDRLEAGGPPPGPGPRRDRGHRRPAGDRPGPVHRQGARRDARRARGGGEHPGPGQHVQRLPAGADVKGRVLVIEDDQGISLGIRTVLTRSGFEVASSGDGKQGLRAFHAARPDLVVLDIGLPSLDGWGGLERIRDLSDVPVLILTAHGSESDKVLWLHGGGEYNLTMPVGHRELAARVEALLRRPRSEQPQAEVYDDGRLLVRLGAREVIAGGAPVPLTPPELPLLPALIRPPRQTLTPAQLLDLAWHHALGAGPERVQVSLKPAR